MADPANPYGLNQDELAQIEEMAGKARKPNLNYTGLALSGLPGGANMGSQLQAQETRVNAGQLNSLTNALNAKSARRETAAAAGGLAKTKAAASVEAARLKAEQAQAASDLANTRRVEAAALAEKGRNERARMLREGKLTDQQKLDARHEQRMQVQEQQHNRFYSPKSIPSAETTKLATGFKQHEAFNRAIDDFKPEYMAGVTMVGKAKDWVAKNISMFADQGMLDKAEWWQNYGYELVLEQRHEMFGAAFTKAEENAWEAVSFTQGMDPAKMQQGMKKRMEVAEKALAREGKSMAKNYRSNDVVKSYAPKGFNWEGEETGGWYEMPEFMPTEEAPVAAGDLSDDELDAAIEAELAKQK